EDGDHAIARPFQRRRRRISHRRPHPAAHHHHCAELLNLRRLSQRSHDIQNAVACIQGVKQVGGLASRLHHNANRARLGIGMLDSDRNPLTLLVESKDYELPRLLLTCNARRLDDKPLDARRKELSVQNFEHVSPLRLPYRILSGMRSPATVTSITRGGERDHKELDFGRRSASALRKSPVFSAGL